MKQGAGEGFNQLISVEIPLSASAKETEWKSQKDGKNKWNFQSWCVMNTINVPGWREG